MIKKNNCFIYPGNKTTKTTNRNNAKKQHKKPLKKKHDKIYTPKKKQAKNK